ncbi:hypothetical protein [Hydrogenophaga sp.]|uniref:hypothetical protein n=1 Tax=Hydrogenophaga sp. TaxID=1904254 RepID=UPI003561AEEB
MAAVEYKLLVLDLSFPKYLSDTPARRAGAGDRRLKSALKTNARLSAPELGLKVSFHAEAEKDRMGLKIPIF